MTEICFNISIFDQMDCLLNLGAVRASYTGNEVIPEQSMLQEEVPYARRRGKNAIHERADRKSGAKAGEAQHVPAPGCTSFTCPR